jgi:c(7)-type cytochrome triheme protein
MPERFGNLLLGSASTSGKVKPVSFSHWLHRTRFTCRVCHSELDFAMKANTSGITESANRNGKFCGTSGCHDGKNAFGHDRPNCGRCHNGNIDAGSDKFASLYRLPGAPFGNRVDWSAALQEKGISPLSSLKTPSKQMHQEEKLQLEAQWTFVPPAVFSHKAHTSWLDCDSCHPDLFSVQKKGTEGLTMEDILKGCYCGFCHLNVAFPMNDCRRCHPGIKQW